VRFRSAGGEGEKWGAHRWVVLGVGLFSSLPVFAKSWEDEGGDVAEGDKDRVGPLRERIPPVSGHLFRKKGRFELSPSASLSIKDAFFTKYMLGLALTYHAWETFGFCAHFTY